MKSMVLNIVMLVQLQQRDFRRLPLASGLKLIHKIQLTKVKKKSSPLNCFKTAISCSIGTPFLSTRILCKNDRFPFFSLFDHFADQATLENIPLSPQWLYSKPSETKDTRAPNSSPVGNSTYPILKEGWRLDGSQDKKEWRRNASEVEKHRLWREEERDTGLLGRRDRRKEGERDNEFRKNDRRTDNVSTREATDTRTSLPSSDRWHDSGRISGHESRWDSKWSSRRGPEDNDKESRIEKRIDAEKEDAHNEKQTLFLGTSRAVSEREADSCDKWRPCHRQVAHLSGVYRAASGFGVERGRVEAPVGFADAFCYPRGKLLDIYRKHKLVPSFESIPNGFEEVPPLTVSSSVEPMAFVTPDAEEEVKQLRSGSKLEISSLGEKK